MELTGLEPRRSDLARGIVIARSARPLDATEQRALWAALAAAGVTEAEEGESSEPTESDEPEPDRQWLAAPWMPPAVPDLEAHAVGSVLGAAQTA